VAQRPAPYPETIHPTVAGRLRRLFGPDWVLGWGLVAPVVLVVLALLAYPVGDAILLSFEERYIGKQGTWVGLANYRDFLFNPNNFFWRSALITLLYTGGAVAGKFCLGLGMASVLNQAIPARNLFRALLFLPWAVPAVVSAYVWRFLFDTTGPINGLIAQFRLADDYIYVFNDARLALPAVVLVAIWAGTPFWTMNFLAGMQAIPPELYEAAEIDGAGTLQRFRYITLPGLKHVILVTALLSTIWTSAALTQIFVLTGGGPNYATTTLPMFAYLTAIPGTRLGAGAAIAMLMMPAYIALVLVLTRYMLRQE